MTASFGVWLAALATLVVYSYLWKENPVFTAAEHIYVALIAAHNLVLALGNIQEMAVKPLTQGKMIWIVPIILGLLLYARFIKSMAPLSRISLSFLVGVGAAISLVGQVDASLVKQVTSTILPLTTFNNFLLVIGAATSVMFFFFTSRAASGPLKTAGTVGRYVLMVSFGAAYGNTVMGRMSLIIGRFGFLLKDWLGIIK